MKKLSMLLIVVMLVSVGLANSCSAGREECGTYDGNGITAKMFINTEKGNNLLNLLVTFDCVILAVAHDEFKKMTLDDTKKFMNEKPVLIDVRGCFDDKNYYEFEPKKTKVRCSKTSAHKK